MNPLLLGGLFDVAKGIINKIWPDPAQQAEAQRKLLELQQTGELAQLAAQTDLAKLQIQTNIEEAKSTSLFIAGWRPFVGWTCGAAFAYTYILLPILQFAVLTFGTAETAAQIKGLPALNLGEMMPVLIGMLGLGGMRSVEKVKNAEGNR